MTEIQKIVKEIDELLLTHSGTLEEIDNDIDKLLESYPNVKIIRIISNQFLNEIRVKIGYMDPIDNEIYEMGFIKELPLGEGKVSIPTSAVITALFGLVVLGYLVTLIFG